MSHLSRAVVALLLVGILSACGVPGMSESPEDVAKGFVQAMAKSDTKKMSDYLFHSVDDPISSLQKVFSVRCSDIQRVFSEENFPFTDVQVILDSTQLGDSSLYQEGSCILVDRSRQGKFSADVHTGMIVVSVVKEDGNWKVASVRTGSSSTMNIVIWPCANC